MIDDRERGFDSNSTCRSIVVSWFRSLFSGIIQFILYISFLPIGPGGVSDDGII